MVEYSPFQKVPTERRKKPDARQGTIEDGERCSLRRGCVEEIIGSPLRLHPFWLIDPDFQQFMQSLQEKKASNEAEKTDAQLMSECTALRTR